MFDKNVEGARKLGASVRDELSQLERDLQALASISNLPDFRRLMRAVALRVGQLLNQNELGRDVALPQSTVHRWLNLLETSFQLVRLPA